MARTPVRYRSDEEDSGRWIGFPFRDGDIVISTRSKSGTTWMQMICALLVFQRSTLPAPLSTLSPWFDWLVVPRDEAIAELEAQRHRRFIKTHTPLDGVPLDRRATYIVVARHPLDAAVSLYHQGDNIDRGKVRRRLATSSAHDVPAPPARPEPLDPPDPPDPAPRDRPGLHDWLMRWIEGTEDPRQAMDSLPGFMWHLSDAWARRHDDNVVLVHYADLSADLDGEMRRLASRLGVTVPDDVWPTLVEAATFERMKARADDVVPGNGVLKSSAAFFRRGTSGAGREVLAPDELARYTERVATMAPPELLDWLHRPPA